ncbi:MAG: cytochrome ubiquinol oxidase subunit I [Planctomycetia bacterium]|nr:cytochrome ubiquinol oxidase subunit I [Planctomycetia bacterium]
MDFLWWYVPYLTSPMLIAIIATVHVFVSHYAVGGGIFLAWEVQHAYRTGNEEYLRYLRRHAKFFILLTVVFGAITGVGIWWTIGLASPLATETLIRVFVFGWATEWVFFVVELVAAFLFFYLWGKLPPKTHVAIGWIYAVAAWISLVLITGITAFMLHPGNWVAATDAGSGPPNFWLAFFNPQFLPQTVARTGAALLLAATYVLLHGAWTLSEKEAKNGLQKLLVRRTARFALLGIVLALVGIVWAGGTLPELARQTLLRAAALNVILGAGAGAAGLLVLLLAIVTWKPQWLSPMGAVALFAMALGTLTAGEFVREAIRKPFVVTNVILSNQITVSQVPALRENGLLESGTWTKPYLLEKYPYLKTAEGKIDLSRVAEKDRDAIGRVVFMHHCNDCHAETFGYSGLGPLSKTGSREELLQFIKNLNSMIYYMPPWCGNDAEAAMLTDYLQNRNREGNHVD